MHPLKAYRERHGLTQEEAAKRLGVTKGHISSIENERYDPGFDLMIKLEEVADIPVSWWVNKAREGRSKCA